MLIDLVYAPKAQYRSNGRFVLNRRTAAQIRKFKDADGNYIWQPAQRTVQADLEEGATGEVGAAGALVAAPGVGRQQRSHADRGRDVDPHGKEAEGLLHAEFFLSRPASERSRMPLESLISVTSGDRHAFGRRFEHHADDKVRLVR